MNGILVYFPGEMWGKEGDVSAKDRFYLSTIQVKAVSVLVVIEGSCAFLRTRMTHFSSQIRVKSACGIALCTRSVS